MIWVVDLTVSRRCTLLPAAPTAAGRGWRRPAQCSPCPEEKLLLPQQLKHNQPMTNNTGSILTRSITSTDEDVDDSANTGGRTRLQDETDRLKTLAGRCLQMQSRHISFIRLDVFIDYWFISQFSFQPIRAQTLTFQSMVAIAVMVGCKTWKSTSHFLETQTRLIWQQSADPICSFKI